MTIHDGTASADGLHNDLTEEIIRGAIEVHRLLGPGSLESVYESAICHELRLSGLAMRRQIGIPMFYKGELLSEFRPDLVVEERVVIEVKSVARLEQIHVAQMLTYLRVTALRVGLILNFNSVVMKNGIRRVVL